MTTPVRRRQRRAFLKRMPPTIAGALAAPVLLDAHAQAPQAETPQGITAETLGVAQQIAGVALPPGERESARPLVARNLANIELIRKVAVPSETEPAFSFRPPRPKIG